MRHRSALSRGAAAQEGASIIGLVQDTSGAVLPGVTVEASSDALIERVRSAVTDGAGRFAIISLRPGAYTVTFTLPGFKTVAAKASSCRATSPRPSTPTSKSARSKRR